MTKEEKAQVAQLEETHYNDHWHQIIMPMLRYRFPHVANEDGFPLKQVKVTRESPLYFHLQFVKPGRSTFVVQQRKSGETVQRKKTLQDLLTIEQEAYDHRVIPPINTYIHHMSTPLRIEPHFTYVNPRQLITMKVDMIPTKNMFTDWYEDSVETHDKIFKADFSATLID